MLQRCDYKLLGFPERKKLSSRNLLQPEGSDLAAVGAEGDILADSVVAAAAGDPVKEVYKL